MHRTCLWLLEVHTHMCVIDLNVNKQLSCGPTYMFSTSPVKTFGEIGPFCVAAGIMWLKRGRGGP